MDLEAAARVPDDALADVLRRLPARALAAARCVCKAWRAVVDGRSLLLPHLLPHSVHGVLVNYIDHDRPHLFSRPCSSSASFNIDGKLSFMPNGDSDWWSVLDHCDGLLLCGFNWGNDLCVGNPATRRWAMLPPRMETTRYAGAYLAFDPAVSPHYEVFLIPLVPAKPEPPVQRRKPLATLFSSLDGAEDEEFQEQVESPSIPSAPASDMDDDDPSRLMEWPPSPYNLKVFSSRTGRWEEKAFVREGEQVTTIEDMLLLGYEYRGARRGYSVYWQGALYVHYRGAFVTRFSLSNDKYQVFKIPINIVDYKYEEPILGKSENGVCFGMIHNCRLSIWILNESAGQMEWVLDCQDDLGPFAKQVESLGYGGNLTNGPWIVEERNIDTPEDTETLSEEDFDSEEDFEWDSENDDFLAVEVGDDGNSNAYFDILGFHPYKKVIFLDQSFKTAAYHWNSSKIQYLGYSRPKCYYQNHTNGIYETFLYTPCMIGELHGDCSGHSSS